MAGPGPVRDREDVMLRPLESLLADGRATVAGHDEADGVMRGAPHARALVDLLEEEVERRHHRAAVAGVTEGPGAVDPRLFRFDLAAYQVARKTVLLGACIAHFPEALVLARPRLEKAGVQCADGWHVGGVEPYGAPGTLIDVAMPAHRRCQHQVTLAHGAAPSVDDGEGTLGTGR